LVVLRLAVLVLFLLSVGFIIWKVTNKQPEVVTDTKQETPAEANVRFFKDSTNPDDMRSLVSTYVAEEKYDEAVAKAKQVNKITQDVGDYLLLLNICAIYSVRDKQVCINDMVSKATPKLSSISFYSAYSTARVLDKHGQKKAAADFYQRAYDSYDPKRAAADEGTMTKEQIKGHIDELRS
jgi:cytoskeletal protein RodZ